MAAPKGHARYGGRAKGTPNRKTKLLQEKCKEFGMDPFEFLCHTFNGNWKALGYEGPTETRYTQTGQTYEVDRISMDHRVSAAREAAQYLYPKRKAVDLTSDGDSLGETLTDVLKALVLNGNN